MASFKELSQGKIGKADNLVPIWIPFNLTAPTMQSACYGRMDGKRTRSDLIAKIWTGNLAVTMLSPGYYHPIYYEMLVTFPDANYRRNAWLLFCFFFSIWSKSLRPSKQQTTANMSEGCARMLICPLMHAERSSCSVFLKGTEVKTGLTFVSLSDYGTW